LDLGKKIGFTTLNFFWKNYICQKQTYQVNNPMPKLLVKPLWQTKGQE
jgi:hypothetical protein